MTFKIVSLNRQPMGKM